MSIRFTSGCGSRWTCCDPGPWGGGARSTLERQDLWHLLLMVGFLYRRFQSVRRLAQEGALLRDEYPEDGGRSLQGDREVGHPEFSV